LAVAQIDAGYDIAVRPMTHGALRRVHAGTILNIRLRILASAILRLELPTAGN
jgi:hypothetical protein